MADLVTTRIMLNGYRNAVIRVSDISDGTGLNLLKIYDATATGAFGVVQAGQTFYPGIHSKLIGLDYDVQDMKIALYWEATVNEQIMSLGSAPEDFKFFDIGGIPVPSGLAGATGSILVSTLNPAPNSTFWLNLRIRKGVPQS